MLKNLTAYPITNANAHILGLISGLTPRTTKANIGWYATYSENSYPRWQLVPKSHTRYEGWPYTVDEESYP